MIPAFFSQLFTSGKTLRRTKILFGALDVLCFIHHPDVFFVTIVLRTPKILISHFYSINNPDM